MTLTKLHTLWTALSLAVLVACAAPASHARSRFPLGTASEQASSIEVAAAGTVEVAFSPDEGGEALVLKVIGSARQDIKVLAYSFTSAPVTGALLAAIHRGVRVSLVADAKNNLSEERSGKARAALSALSSAGADVRVISAYPIHHDKVIVVDARTVQMGSFNYSDAAAHRNSENVLVHWANPDLAAVYLTHFVRNHRQSVPFVQGY